MKKIILVLAVLALAIPAMAGITVTTAQVGTTSVVQVSYTATDGNIPRAFALDFTMSPANATALAPYGFNPNFYVAPGTFTYDPCTGATNWGNPIVGPNTVKFTCEMGSLWDPCDPCTAHRTQPPSTGTLFSFNVDKTCTISVAQNAARGGVVMENTAITFPAGYVTLVTPVTVTVTPTECLYLGRVFPATAGFNGLTVSQAQLDRWHNLGSPNCWCCQAQKRGNGVYTGGSATKTDLSDAAALKNSANWNQTTTAANACLDFNFSGKIDLSDAAILKNTNNWNQIVGSGPPCN